MTSKKLFSFQKIELISSEQNPKFKTWASLLLTKGRKKESLFILSGEKIIRDFLQYRNYDKFPISCVLIPNKEQDFSEHSLLESFPKETTFFRLESSLMNQLDIVGTHSFLLVLKLPIIEEVTLPSLPQGLEVLCPIGDPNNLGAVIRSALAFGVKRILLTKNAADPFNQKTIKSSSGAVLNIEMAKVNKELQHISFSELTAADIGLDLNGQNIHDFSWPQDCRLWLGEEGPGLKIIPSEQCLFIPIKGIESLNVSIAAGISFFSYQNSHYFRKGIKL